jgi:hypothetical protein
MKAGLFAALLGTCASASDRCVVTVGEDFADGPLLYKTLEPFAVEDGYLERPPHLGLFPHEGDQVEVISAPTDFISIGDPLHKWRYAQVRVVSGSAKGEVGWAAMERDDDAWLYKPSKACLYSLWQAPVLAKIDDIGHTHESEQSDPTPIHHQSSLARSYLFMVSAGCLLLGAVVSALRSRPTTIVVIQSECDFEEPFLNLVEV